MDVTGGEGGMRVRYISPVDRPGQPLYTRSEAERKIIHEDVFPLPDIDVNLFAYGGEGTLVAPHWHDDLEIMYVERSSGPVEIVVDGQRQIRKQDDLILFNTREIHEVLTEIGRGIVLQIPVRVWKQFVPEYDQLTFSLDQLKTRDKRHVPAMKRMMVEMYDIYQAKETGYKLRFNSLLCELMYTLLRFCAVDAKRQTGQAMQKKIVGIAEVMEYIEQHHAEKLTVAAVADEFGYHPNYLSRLFQQSVGHTVLEYIYMVRIHQVYCDVLYTDKAVRRIFEDHGCTNSKVAMRMFKATYQATPQEIRKRKLSETDKS